MAMSDERLKLAKIALGLRGDQKPYQMTLGQTYKRMVEDGHIAPNQTDNGGAYIYNLIRDLKAAQQVKPAPPPRPTPQETYDRHVRLLPTGVPQAKYLHRPENVFSEWDVWERRWERLLQRERFVKIMHMNDLHLPFHDPAAVDLWVRIAADFQPHIVVVGSDALDLPIISRFPRDPDMPLDDWLAEGKAYWWEIVHLLRKHIPNATLVWRFGNHDQRGWQDIKTTSVPQTLTNVFISHIRAEGEVLFLDSGETLVMQSLAVIHGDSASRYAAATLARKWGGRVAYINAGHTHRPQQIGNTVINGCLCQLLPHYADKGYPNEWQHGTSTIVLDTETQVVSWSQHTFEIAGDVLIAQAGSQLYTTPYTVPQFHKR